ncbi:MAG: hypothetical protein WC969_09695 [Elusimicrobiota bacterium]|jgi:hypothetical protein
MSIMDAWMDDKKRMTEEDAGSAALRRAASEERRRVRPAAVPTSFGRVTRG